MRQLIQTAKHNQNTLSQTASGAKADRDRQAQPAPLLALQALGNQAMQSLLRSRAIQAKLNISTPGDEYEQEADRVAETVMRMPSANGAQSLTINAHPTGAVVQRMCQECEEEDDTVQAKEMSGHHPQLTPQLQTQVNELRGKGRPLSEAERGFFEPRFGRDFSQLRIHSDARAAESARSINALAYTTGQNIVFGAGQYAPSSVAGRRLMAHELTHVLQQRGGQEKIQRQAGGGPGTSTYEEHVGGITASSSAPGVWEGEVNRRELDKQKTVISRGRVPLKYDENSCQVTLPVRVSFRHPTLADLARCLPQLGQPAPKALPTPLDDSSFRKLATQYVSVVNNRLNGWYSVRLEGCESNHCHGRDIPIKVEVTEVPAGPTANFEVVLANMEGRSCVSPDMSGGMGFVLLYASGLSKHTMAHEGGHMVLGHGDEYEETAKGVSRPLARVRDKDWSLMNDEHAFGNWSLLHERHFAFVPAFINKVRPGCQARLQELSRPLDLTIGASFSLGYSSYAGGGGYLGLGLNLGLPLDRLRKWQLAVGIQGQVISNLDVNSQMAYLLGLRVSMERTFTPSAGGFRVGAFAEAGVGKFIKDSSSQSGKYGEAGLSFGYSVSPDSGLLMPFVAAEFGLGRRLDTDDPKAEKWFRAGLSAGIRFF